MSLILEALKKLDREKGVPNRGFLVMAPMEWRASRRRAGLLVGTAVAGVLVTALAAAWWLRGPGRPQRVSSAPAGPASAAGPLTAPASLPVPAEPVPGPAAAVEATEAAPGPEAVLAGATSRGGPADVAADETAPPPERTLAAPDRGRDRRPAAEGAGPQRPVAGTDRAHEAPFQLQAISERDGQPVAVLNDRLVREGDSFDGVRVLKIGADHVEIEVRGQRRVVRF